jgi:hypothetical protein
MKSVVKFAPAEGVYPSAAITPVCVFGTLAACAAAAAPAASNAVVAAVAADPNATPFVFVHVTEPPEAIAQSPDIVCGAYPVPPTFPTNTCPAAGTLADPVPPLAGAIAVPAVTVPAVTVVNVPAAGVAPPITVPSIDPLVIAAAPVAPPPPGGAFQLPSSRRYRVVPTVAPGSGTAPTAWLVPLPPNTGSTEGVSVPVVILEAVTPVTAAAFTVVALIVPALKPEGVKLYEVPRRLYTSELVPG